MCKNYGKVFIDELQMTWAGNHSIMRDPKATTGDYLTEEKFCFYHDLPKGFFGNKIKNIVYDVEQLSTVPTMVKIINIREKEKL